MLRRERSPHDILTILSLMQPGILLAFLVARAHCWLMFILVSTRTPRSFFEELLSICVTHSMYWCLELFIPRCRTLHLCSLRSWDSCQLTSPGCQFIQSFRKFEPLMQICRALRLDSDYLKIFEYVSTALSVLLSLISLEDQSCFWPLELYLFKAYISS